MKGADTDGQELEGFEIGALDLHAAMKKLGREISADQADSLLNAIDTDKSGTINYQEFQAMSKGHGMPLRTTYAR